MLGCLLQRSGQFQEFFYISAICQYHIRYFRMTCRDGSGLIKYHRIHQMSGLQAFTGFDQDSLLGSSSSSYHNGRRCCQSQCTGAGNNKYGDTGCQCKAEGLSKEQPYHDRNQGDGNDHRYKNTADFIGQFGNRRFGATCLLYQTDNLGKSSILADAVCFHLEITCTVDSRPGHPVAFLLLHRNTLTGDGGFIHGSGSFGQNTIHRNALSRFYNNGLTDLDLLYRNLYFLSIP